MSMVQMWEVECDGIGKHGYGCMSNDIAHGSKSIAINEIKKHGWKRTRIGWLCPECLEVEKERRSQRGERIFSANID